MLCISVAPVSRKLAKADLLNAAGQCDLVELCLDHFLKEPDVGDMLQGIPKPILVACRRPQDGGRFNGTEEERMTLLRQAIVAGPEYVELDLDAPKYPVSARRNGSSASCRCRGLRKTSTRSTTRPSKPKPIRSSLPGPHRRSRPSGPCSRSFHRGGRFPSSAWRSAAARTRWLCSAAPGAPWCYAALERGLESVPGQPTVWDLKETYCWDDINSKTRFVGLAGPIDRQMTLTARALNAAFRKINDRHRCLPLPVQSFDRLGERLERLKISAVLAAPELAPAAIQQCQKLEGSAEPSGYADILLHQDHGWTGYHSLWRHMVKALENRLGRKDENDHPLGRRNVLVVGCGGLAQSFIYGVQRHKGVVSVTAPNEKVANQLAQKLAVRHVPFHNLYDTLADVVVLADPGMKMGSGKGDINPGYFRESMTVMDLSAMPDDTPILEEVRARGCKVVNPSDVFRALMATQFEALTGQSFPATVWTELEAAGP